jgi:hypothetical protein
MNSVPVCSSVMTGRREHAKPRVQSLQSFSSSSDDAMTPTYSISAHTHAFPHDASSATAATVYTRLIDVLIASRVMLANRKSRSTRNRRQCFSLITSRKDDSAVSIGS